MKNYALSLFLFHRDLRIQDNTGLIEALKESEEVLPCFIFDPVQASTDNKYKSNNALQFMIHSLEELSQEIKSHKGKLYIFYGDTEKTISQLLKSQKATALFSNADYTPFSQKRDKKLELLCKKQQVEFIQYHDALLNPPEEILKKDGSPYSVFTPFYKHASTFSIQEITHASRYTFATPRIPQEHEKIFTKVLSEKNPTILLKGGRKEGLRLLKQATTNKGYDKKRDFPAQEGTTLLSAHHKFGTISIRESYHALASSLGKSSGLVRQLYWRDFFTHIAYHFPHVFGQAFHQKYNALSWSSSAKNFDAWCNGMTGFPIVDAGMRQLNATGYMHNRLRMIVASFLTKDLHISWRKGEWYFATKLLDYDPCVNNGSWQWAASTGCDAQPYFRIFNPWLQQKKFDPQAEFIKEWIPELKDVLVDDIHGWETKHKLYEGSYPKPIVDHKQASSEAKALFKKAS